MAAKKRKPVRSAVKKAVKKPAKVLKKSSVKAKGRKMKASSSQSKPSLKLVRSNPVTSVDKPFTKGQLFTALADCSGLPRKVVSSVFEDLSSIIAAHLKKQGPGQFTLPGLVKMTLIQKPATKARKGINPFTGEEMMFKAKPARNVVKVRPLKALKEVV